MASIEVKVTIDPKAIEATVSLAGHLEEASRALFAAADDMEAILYGRMNKEKLDKHNLRYRWNMFKAKLLRPYWEWRSRNTPPDCGFGCDWVYPYGFVPEADCPVHDK